MVGREPSSFTLCFQSLWVLPYLHTAHNAYVFRDATGNAPSTRSGLLQAVRLATAKGIVVVALTQCYQVRARQQQ